MAVGCHNRFGIPFWGIGEFTTHFRTYFGGWIESDVHWGYDLDFDPWPNVSLLGWAASEIERSHIAKKFGVACGSYLWILLLATGFYRGRVLEHWSTLWGLSLSDVSPLAL